MVYLAYTILLYIYVADHEIPSDVCIIWKSKVHVIVLPSWSECISHDLNTGNNQCNLINCCSMIMKSVVGWLTATQSYVVTVEIIIVYMRNKQFTHTCVPNAISKGKWYLRIHKFMYHWTLHLKIIIVMHLLTVNLIIRAT